MKFKKRLCQIAMSAIVLLLISISAFAQQTIRGTLRSSTGEALSGATVSVKGTNRSVVTDQNGEFNIQAATGSTLVISYVGYEGQEVAVSSADPLSISLTALTTSMNEVVVVGYGTQRRKEVTGSVVSINTKDLPQVANTSINNLLQGRAAGLNLNQRSAQPGGGLSVNIRGGGTPLYVIDGVPLFNNFGAG